MGMELRGMGGCFRFSHEDWRNALELARMHGWEPMGTVAPNISRMFTTEQEEKLGAEGIARKQAEFEAKWERYNYFSNSGQNVSEEDAHNLADAVEKALEDIPRHRAREGGAGWLPQPIEKNPKANLVEYFSGSEGREHLEKFVTFCRAGAFCIH